MQDTQHFMQVKDMFKVGERHPVATEPGDRLRGLHDARYVQACGGEREKGDQNLQPVAWAAEKLALLF